MLHLNVSEVDQTASSLIYFIMVLSSEQEISNTTLKSLDISRPNPGCMYYFDSVHFANVIGHMLKVISNFEASINPFFVFLLIKGYLFLV